MICFEHSINQEHLLKFRWSDLFVRPIRRRRDTNPQHWKFLFFYYNLDDRRLFVPKRWTGNPFMLNFARPAAWVIAAITLLILIVVIPLVKR
jgi:uncharacterized membrane protein